MRLKYYLRGLGIGMVVTALLMGVAKENKTMTDEEIKARALQLGMVEQKTLADVRETVANAKNEEEIPERPIVDSETWETEENRENVSKDDTESTEAAEMITSQENNETDATEFMEESTDSQAKEPEEDIPEEIVILQVVKGDRSKSVSKKAEELGLVESASEFNEFLIEKELTQRIIIGEYEIVMGSDMEEIARIITK